MSTNAPVKPQLSAISGVLEPNRHSRCDAAPRHAREREHRTDVGLRAVATPGSEAQDHGRGERRERRSSSSSGLTGMSIGWPGTANMVTTNRVWASARLLPSW